LLLRGKVAGAALGAGVGALGALLFFGTWLALARGGEPGDTAGTEVFVGVAARASVWAAALGAGIGALAGTLRRYRVLTLVALALAAVPLTATLTMVGMGSGPVDAIVFGLAISVIFGCVTVPIAAAAGCTFASCIAPRSYPR